MFNEELPRTPGELEDLGWTWGNSGYQLDYMFTMLRLQFGPLAADQEAALKKGHLTGARQRNEDAARKRRPAEVPGGEIPF